MKAILELFCNISYRNNKYFGLDGEVFKSKYKNFILPGTEITGGAAQQYACSYVTLNMDMIQTISINSIQVNNTYATGFYIALLDEPPTCYEDVYNNQLGSYINSNSAGTIWSTYTTNILIDCSDLTGNKYLATAHHSHNNTYTSAMALISDITIIFK